MTLQNDLTHGKVSTQILKFAVPLIFSNIFQALYNAVDMFFVGRFVGTAGLSAVSVSGPIMNIMLMTINGLSLGVGVIIGNYAGNGNEKKVKSCANTAICVYGILGVLVTFLGILFCPAILRLVSTPDQAFVYAQSYLTTVFTGTIFLFGYNLIGAFQRAFGDSRSSMMFVIVATAVNIVLDYLFIGILQMATFGAALATVIAQAMSFVLGVAYFRLNKHIITFSPKELRIDLGNLKEMLQLGFPSALQQGLITIAQTTLSGIANSFGMAVSAAYGIGMRIDSFAVLPSDAINMSVSSFSSQNVGAGNYDRAVEGAKSGAKISVTISLVLMGVVMLFAPYLAGIFDQNPDVIAASCEYLHISAFSYLFYATVYPQIGLARGGKNVMFTLKNSIISQYLVRIPCALFFTKVVPLGFAGVAIAVALPPLWSTITFFIFIKSGKWRHKTEQERMEQQ